MGFRVTGAALWLAGLLTSGKGDAAEPDWYVDGAAGWKSRATLLDAGLVVTVDGRVINPVNQGTQNDAASPNTGKDTAETVIKTTVNKIAVSHEVRLDSRRNALRILDILTNEGTAEKNIRVELRTQMRSNSQLKYNGFITDAGEVLENGNAPPENTQAIILLAELPTTPAVPLFVWGEHDAAWPVSIHEVGGSVRLGYEGVIKPGEKAALIHWVGTAGLDKSVKLERTFDLFLKSGKLIDPLLHADVLPHVVNFKPESLSQSASPADVGPVTAKLVALDKLCEKLELKRGDKDILWISKDEVFKGKVEVEKVSFAMGDRNTEIDWKTVAAVRGGGRRGRVHRLYLRDGSVWDGRVSFSNAKLAGDIGSMVLDGEALELLLCHTQPEDGQLAEGAGGFMQTLNGRHFWVSENGIFSTKLVSHFGVLNLEADDVWLVRRKTEPPYDQTVTLMDGSRIQGVLANSLMTTEIAGIGAQSFSISELSRWGKMEALMEEAEEAAGKKTNASPPTRYCWLRDGSFLVGSLTDDALVFHTRHEDITLKSHEIARLAPLDSDSSQLTVELLNGTKFKGRLLQDSVSWQLGKQVVILPVGLITELVRKDQP